MPALHYLKICGTPFESGHAMGRFAAPAMHAYASQSPAWQSVVRHRGSPLVRHLELAVQTSFPRIWQELQGLAAGLQLPLEDVFLWNCRGDIWAMAPDGCTTVQTPGRVRRITHNEDGDPAFAGHCAVAEFHVKGGASFASFLYPGSLPGHTFAVTDNGLAMTVNNLRCLDVQPGVPRMVLTRALLEAVTLDQATALLESTQRAGGFHLTLAHVDAPQLLSVEFSSRICSVVQVEQRALHANHAVHPVACSEPQIVTHSSRHRQSRGEELLAAAADQACDPLVVLADHRNNEFPILRTSPLDSDTENTLATADIRISRSGIEWQVYESPGLAPRFNMIAGHVEPQAQKNV